MQLIERVRDTEFLGREFLLWLWHNSEVRGGTYKLADGDVELWVDKKIVLRHDDDEGTEKIIERRTLQRIRHKKHRRGLVEPELLVDDKLLVQVHGKVDEIVDCHHRIDKQHGKKRIVLNYSRPKFLREIVVNHKD